MKKYVLFLLFIILLIMLIPKEPKEFRIRVIANSNSRYDQELKMEVVEVVKKEIKTYDEENIVAEIKNHLNDIEEAIHKKFPDKDITISIQKVRFPPKSINGEVIKGGRYETLLIEIGNAEGKNWWSLLYPEFSNISFEDLETSDVEVKFYFWEKLKNLINH